ncbi:MAG: hypothetical protein H6726_18650 [Sandaracinaceae bacterium]|nr:hypothetical protein [Sandaracinaceae bacterium]
MTAGLAPMRWVGTTSRGIARIPHIRSFVGADVILRPAAGSPVDAMVGWGRKPNTQAARAMAEKRGVPFLTLEDGFVRSVGLGVSGAPPWSIVVDDVGIYYDATRPSRLEVMLEESGELDDAALLARARRCMDRMRQARISKYNASPVVDLGPRTRPRVLVVDQTPGDLSLKLGLAPGRGVVELVEAALAERPDAEIIVKTHPDVVAGRRGESPSRVLQHARVRLVTAAANPIAMLEQVDEVFVMTSLLGFEALLMGLPVTCFGAPFYAGWGVTTDRVATPRRNTKRSVEQIFAAAYLRYARYVDPVTGAPAELERVIEHVATQTGAAGERAPVIALGFSLWKRGFLDAFLDGVGGQVSHARDAVAAEGAGVPRGATLVVWGATVDPAVEALAARHGARVARMEDGFLRSVGLGSDLYAPASLVVDTRGIYYDPTRPSDLEHLLATRTFDERERTRAARLRERIVLSGVSKYNAARGRTLQAAHAAATGRRVVLVVGQVEDDASIRLGCVDVRTNTELLRAARAACPDAFLVWKPHPDVTSGNRRGRVDPAVVAELSDEVAEDVAIAACLNVADEVHTMTSLVGFEALLREKDVVVYGLPFYAGWGLTRDRHAHPRRTRRLSLDELVHATLIDYPVYVDPVTETRTNAEAIVGRLEQSLRSRGSVKGDRIANSWGGRQARKLGNLARYALRSDPRGARLLREASSVAGTLLGKTTPSSATTPTLPDFGVTHALLLQGPAGPFFWRLGRELRQHGIEVTKVNLHAGDAIFYPAPNAVSYRGTLDEFGGWIAHEMRERRVDGIFLFGDCRAYHLAAIEAARAAGVAVWVFEEGYLRPDWLTYERDGVNGHSRMSRDPEYYVSAYRAAGCPPEPPVLPVGDTFTLAAWYSTLNAVAYTFANQAFPAYQHHRNLNALYHARSWVTGAARKQYYARRERGVLEEILERFDGRFFFVPLQVHCDFQIQHSSYDDVTDFIHEVVASFAGHAPRDHALVLKHHPMDRPFRDYSALFRALRRDHGLDGRLYYIHDQHLPTLLKHARGCVTINSTVGLSAIHHRTPTKVMGKAIYDMPGLTHQGDLESMWDAPEMVNVETYQAFRWWLLEHNQANGNIMNRLPTVQSPTGVLWR